MPPARKDQPEADDPSRPSTSRAFSPTLAPPVKRARTSTGVAPASSLSRRQSAGTGGRQARMEEFIDEKELQEALLAALTATADELLKEDEEEGKEKIEIESEVISAAAGIVWDAMAEDWAADLVAFSRHAGRETIREEDVKLLMRRNPDMLAEVLGECAGEEEGEGSTTMGTIRRRSTGGLQLGRSRMGARDGEDTTEVSEAFITPIGASSMESIVPETPQANAPLAHSTPMSGRSKSIAKKKRGAEPSFSLPSPIREDEEGEEEEAGRIEGRRPNRSIMEQLSATLGERRGGQPPGMGDDDFTPSVIDLRHPREQEEEERRMRGQDQRELPIGPSTGRPGFDLAGSPELFEHSEIGEGKKEADHDSFDDDLLIEDKKSENGGRGAEASLRMNESAALREMLSEDEQEKENTAVKEMEDSFDDDSIQFVEEKKATQPVPAGGFPSTSAARATVQPSSGSAAAAAVSAMSIRSSQDSFFNDEILDDVPQAVTAPAAAAASTMQQPRVPAAVQPVRIDDYDSFDDDDDDFVTTPVRSKENTPRAIGGPAPSSTVANRWSTVVVEEVVSPAAQKNSATTRGAFAADIFGLNDPQPSSKQTQRINKPSPTVSTKPSPTVSTKPSPTVSTKPSPTVSTRPSPAATVRPKTSPTVPISISPTVLQAPQSAAKQTTGNKTGKAVNGTFASFSFFGEESSGTPDVQREDSEFLDSSTKQTPSATRTPRGRGRGGGRGTRGFPRKVDPNSKANRMSREQSTPVRLSPRPPSRISEIVGSFEDDDFDVSAFDD